MSENTKPANRLLAALSVKEYKRLLSKLEETSLIYGDTIFKPGDVIRHVYFPGSGIVSLLSAIEERSLLEIGMVGNEGFVGLPVFLGVKTSSDWALIQGAGAALKMKTADFLAECEKGGTLSAILKRYTHSFIIQISQSAVCGRFHAIEARLARWLLMTSDRMASDEFQITQKTLSNMLGVRREAVNKSENNLRQSGLIGKSRRKITILNRVGLQAAACRCYFMVKAD